jgi:hypothetical protein
MNRFIKIVSIIALVIFAIILVVAAYLANPKNFTSVFAEGYMRGELICDEPIPIGQVIEETTDLANDIYIELNKVKNYIAVSVGLLNNEVAALSVGGDEICDYSVCKPDAPNTGGKVGVEVDLSSYLFKFPSFGIDFNILHCVPKKCKGNPCPDLTQVYVQLQERRIGIQGAYKRIHDIITKETELVTYDIKKINPVDGSDDKGQNITRSEEIKRYTQLIREWLSPSPETGKQSCALSDLERKRVEAGTAGARFPMRCADALADHFYWPKVWSENCINECKEGPNVLCKTCLGQKPLSGNWDASSVLAKINYKIYEWSTSLLIAPFLCGPKCSKGELDKDCAECLLTEAKKVGDPKLTDSENFTSWICGGYYGNYVCCHETEPIRE